MAEEKKEAFLQRWSRLKQEHQDAPVKDETPAPQLPPVDKLTPESDYTGFMHPKVDQALRRVALKKMFNDPHFNTPDPFEPFSGDWNVAEPISGEMLKTLNQARTHLFGEDDSKTADTTPAKEDKPDTASAPTDDEPRRENT